MGRLAFYVCAAGVVFSATTARAQTLGYQFGILQSVGTTFGDDLNTATLISEDNRRIYQEFLASRVILAEDPLDGGVMQDDEIVVQSLQGFQLITTMNSNMTLDFVGRRFSHGFVLGAQLSQLIPVGVPENENEQVEQQNIQLRQRLTTAAVNTSWLGRISYPRWQLTFGGGYTLGVNGRLGNAANGQVQGNAQANGGVNPAAQAGAFAFNGLTHAFIARTGLQIRRTRSDFNFDFNYNYSENGIFTLSTGAPGAAAAPGNNATPGAFVSADLHTISPNATYRTRIGRRGTLLFNVGTTYTKPLLSEDDVDQDGIDTIITPAQQGIPETLITSARFEGAYVPRRGRAFGVDLSALYNLRVETDATGAPRPGATLTPDTMIYSPRAFYRARLPWQIQLQVAAGVAQALLFQPPFGQEAPGGTEFQTVRSNFEPVASFQISRFFDPVQATLNGGREIAPGVFGASAVATEFANLAFTHQLEISREARLTTTAGFNVNRTKTLGRELFAVGAEDILIAAGDNVSIGGTAGMALPIFQNENITLDATLTYNVNWVDSDPNDEQRQDVELDCARVRPEFDCETVRADLDRLAAEVGVEPTLTHVALFTLRGTWGRGTPQTAAGIGGRTTRDELDAFTADPATGSPLITAQLLSLGANFNNQGELPGDPAPTRQDSRREFQAETKRAAEQREQLQKNGAVVGRAGVEQEQQEAAQKEKKEAEEKRDENTERSFGDWPFAPPGESTETPPPEPDATEPAPE